MSKIVNKTVLLRAMSNKQNPGVFPNKGNCNVNVLDIPKLIGGKRRKKYKRGKKNKRGGSDWISTLRSGSVNPQTQKHVNKFSKRKQYQQHKNSITSGRMFNPFTLKNKMKGIIKKNKIGPFKISRKISKFINKIQDYPMFRLLKL